MLSNHFYIGEVKYKGEILSGEQPPILDRALFEAVRQKALAQWSHRTLLRDKSDHLLAGLLFDDTGHRGRQWLDDVISGRVTTIAALCEREKCSVRQVNMTISLAFLAPKLIKAAVEGRLPRGIGIERLRDPPAEWSRQFEAVSVANQIRTYL